MEAAVLSQVEASDAESLVAIRIEAMRESLERIGRFDATRARQRFLSGFLPEHTSHIVVGGERVGFVVVKPGEGTLLLDHLYVRPEFQRRGIGANVLAQVFARADAERAPVHVGALKGSDSNRFYERHGFQLVREEEWDNYYVRPRPLLAERVVVIGMSGAGKTSVAREIAALTGAPHTELDALFWGPEWEPVPPSEFRRLAAEAVAGPRWVVDGNYSGVRAIVWPRAQIVVWLDLPFTMVFARVFARTMRRAMSGETLWQGNRESLGRTFFSRESILWWVISTYRRRRREFAALRASGQFPDLEWVVLQSPAQVGAFVERWR